MCEVFTLFHFLTLHHSPALPDNTNIEFSPTMLALTCTSTGFPATTVTWTKDGDTLTVDGTTYSMTQTVTDRLTSTYENVLSISSDATSIVGDYTCTVSNALGSDSVDFTVRGTYEYAM